MTDALLRDEMRMSRTTLTCMSICAVMVHRSLFTIKLAFAPLPSVTHRPPCVSSHSPGTDHMTCARGGGGVGDGGGGGGGGGDGCGEEGAAEGTVLYQRLFRLRDNKLFYTHHVRAEFARCNRQSGGVAR